MMYMLYGTRVIIDISQQKNSINVFLCRITKFGNILLKNLIRTKKELMFYMHLVIFYNHIVFLINR